MPAVYIEFTSAEEKRAAGVLDFVVRKNAHTGSTTGYERIHLRWTEKGMAEILHCSPVTIQENAIWSAYLGALGLLGDLAAPTSRPETAATPPPPTN